MAVYPLLGMLVVWCVKLADDKRAPFDEDKAMLLESNLAVSLKVRDMPRSVSGPCRRTFREIA